MALKSDRYLSNLIIDFEILCPSRRAGSLSLRLAASWVFVWRVALTTEGATVIRILVRKRVNCILHLLRIRSFLVLITDTLEPPINVFIRTKTRDRFISIKFEYFE
ncbi:hypothetical protein ALC57_17513 [Trachymyrmex cornetzi]|uniref:Uncharacterized protein n=1 Tax=Trachymyrmex cornetzi TaxID=471704 RepID=A0A195DBS5_9HYME|nr:hypothetical protein ALC57_17513 [Trachymyrmex cornetzi]